ncbi:hypothetical protein GWI33_009692 [Rhynchophorus ferrugineus]|uniref:Uncharacterized protein n=1 Tax=Rhynchophorus ferrugineus TaxID=354439 RepID=A0A834IA91_RHYFE|nr:hypothetical protein GWI33_009692 [Rhynchophorus ferrugineus]
MTNTPFKKKSTTYVYSILFSKKLNAEFPSCCIVFRSFDVTTGTRRRYAIESLETLASTAFKIRLTSPGSALPLPPVCRRSAVAISSLPLRNAHRFPSRSGTDGRRDETSTRNHPRYGGGLRNTEPDIHGPGFD